MDQELQTCAWRNFRLDLSAVPGCCYVLLTALQSTVENWVHTQFTRKHFSHSNALRILSTFSCFQFHLLLPTRSFSLKLWPIIKLWASMLLQTHAYSFSTACQKTFAPQESFVRTQSESWNSFIAGYHLWLNSFKAFTRMSINLSIWI